LASKREQLYKRRIAELEKQVAELLKVRTLPEVSLRTDAGQYRKRPTGRAASYRYRGVYERRLSLLVFYHSQVFA